MKPLIISQLKLIFLKSLKILFQNNLKLYVLNKKLHYFNTFKANFSLDNTNFNTRVFIHFSFFLNCMIMFTSYCLNDKLYKCEIIHTIVMMCVKIISMIMCYKTTFISLII